MKLQSLSSWHFTKTLICNTVKQRKLVFDSGMTDWMLI